MNYKPCVAAGFGLRSKCCTIVFGLSAVVALACCQITAEAADKGEEKLSKAATATCDRLEKQIQAEIKALGLHQWAGEYYWGDGLGANVTLSIAPKHGYVFRWRGCLGLYDQNCGAVMATNGELRLSFTYKNEQRGFQGIAERFIPVSWGSRKYLVPSDDVIGFCNQINEGSEPRDSIRGSYLLRRGDEKVQVSGFPNLPADFQGYLLKQPIEAQLTAVGSHTTRPGVADLKFIDTTVTLNAGKIRWLLPGMELVVVEPAQVVQSVRVTKVDDNTSEGLVTQAGEDEPGPSVGMRVSTRASWHKSTGEKP